MNRVASRLQSDLWCLQRQCGVTLCQLLSYLTHFFLLLSLRISIRLTFDALSVLREKPLGCGIRIERDSGAVRSEPNISVPHDLMHRVIQRVNV